MQHDVCEGASWSIKCTGIPTDEVALLDESEPGDDDVE
jgi:hypothetical protein